MATRKSTNPAPSGQHGRLYPIPTPAAPDQAAMDAHKQVLDLEDLQMNSKSVIALLKLFAEHIPSGFCRPEDKDALVRVEAMIEGAANTLRAACSSNTKAAYMSAGKTVDGLLWSVGEEMQCVGEENAELLWGLLWAIENFLSARVRKPEDPAQPPAAGAISAPASSSQAGGPSAGDAVREVVRGVMCELGSIRELAYLLSDQANSGDGERFQALAVSIERLTESIEGQLEREEARFAETAASSC